VQGSYGNIAAFRLHRPTSAAEACSLVGELGDRVALMAGGVDLLQDLKAGLPIEHLIYLKAIKQLRRIEACDDSVRLGACATHHDIETDAVVAEYLPSVAGIWGDVANARVRIAGTIGGNILAGNARYDGLPPLIALDATAIFETVAGTRRTRVDEVLGDRNAILSAIEVPKRYGRYFAFDRSLKPAVSVAVSIAADRGKVEHVRAGIGCAHASPVGGRLPIDPGTSLETLAKSSVELAAAFAQSLPEPIEDLTASSAYRRRMIALQLARQLRALCEA